MNANHKKVLAIIMGGGKGTRLQPLTSKRSKPAVSIAGKYRLIDIPISNCINSGIARMFVLTQFNAATLNRHLKNTYQFSPFSQSFVDVLAAEQTPGNSDWFLGTADAVRKSMHHILRHDFDYALILSGDQLYQMDFSQMIAQHINNQAEITIATTPVKADEASAFGILKSEKTGRITSFVEKPSHEILAHLKSETNKEMQKQKRNYLASMGIYLFNKDLLISLMSETDKLDFGAEIIPDAVIKQRVFSYQYQGYWTDIGSIDCFYKANIGLTHDQPEFDLYSKEHKIYTRARILPTSKIENTQLSKTLIAEGCIIQAEKIEQSVVGIRSVIGLGTKIIGAYVMGNDYYETTKSPRGSEVPLGIGKNCLIKKAIVDKNCHIGNNVRIEGGSHLNDTEHENYTINSGIVIIKTGTTIPDGTIIK